MSGTRFLSPRGRPTNLLLQIVPAVLILSQPAVAQTAGDPSAGHQLAKTWCQSCHIVDAAQQQGVSNGAPPFAAVAAMKSTTSMSLAAFLQTPHDRMPDLHLNRDEINNITAYILSLRK